MIAAGNVPFRTPEAFFRLTDDQARRSGKLERAGVGSLWPPAKADPDAGLIPS
jgi:hypothetical protein